MIFASFPKIPNQKFVAAKKPEAKPLQPEIVCKYMLKMPSNLFNLILIKKFLLPPIKSEIKINK